MECLKGFPKDACLEDFRGRWLVLYFYPRDNTPGCTIEGKEFSSLKEEFESLGAVVVGVSPDSPESHKRFAEKNGIRILLLSDPDKSLMKKFGAYGVKKMYGRISEGVIRSTFIISPEGKIVKEFRNVKAKGHAAKVLEELKTIIKKKK